MALAYRRTGNIALIALAHPPVNALSRALRSALVEAFERVRSDDAVEAVVLYGTGKGFCAGGDRSEFGTPDATARPTLSRDVLTQAETCGKPVVAALHGFAVGGGLELALTCHARVAVGATRVGLPEVSIGLLPLSGTQRLPRVVGIERAADLMMNATIVAASSLRDTPLIDRFVDREEDLLPAATQLAQHSVVQPPRLIREWPFPDPDPAQALRRVFDRYAMSTLTAPQQAALNALDAAVHARDFQTGIDRAQVLFDQLVQHRNTMTGQAT